jgi:tRNA(Arg) A34 adenosine deaminase TadA
MKTFALIFLFIIFCSMQLNAQPKENSIEENENYMKMAIELAKTAVDNGNYPFGAVVVKNGVVVGRGSNSSHSTNDATAHGEINAIRDACKNLGTNWLEGCELYTNGEPCPMCFAACFFANIKHIYFGATKEDMTQWGVVDMRPYDLVCQPLEQREVKSEVILREESGKLFEDWSKTNKKKW